ncbi:MAG: PASTA domain-containing protein [Euzebya sp.]
MQPTPAELLLTVAAVAQREHSTLLLPDVVGLATAEAREVLDDAGLMVEVALDYADAGQAQGTVLRSDPPAGSDVTEGSRVTLIEAVTPRPGSQTPPPPPPPAIAPPAPVADTPGNAGESHGVAAADTTGDQVAPPPATAVISGTVVVYRTLREQAWDEGQCVSGTGGYDDISQGAEVRVKGADGTILAVGRLGPGEWRPVDDTYEACHWPFGAISVPVVDLYTVETTHRGGVTYNRGELDANDWTVQLAL